VAPAMSGMMMSQQERETFEDLKTQSKIFKLQVVH
jgi:hypothetical protein